MPAGPGQPNPSPGFEKLSMLAAASDWPSARHRPTIDNRWLSLAVTADRAAARAALITGCGVRSKG
jgi:hypothetical protein